MKERSHCPSSKPMATRMDPVRAIRPDQALHVDGSRRSAVAGCLFRLCAPPMLSAAFDIDMTVAHIWAEFVDSFEVFDIDAEFLDAAFSGVEVKKEIAWLWCVRVSFIFSINDQIVVSIFVEIN